MRSPIARLLTFAGHEAERFHRKVHGRPFEVGDRVLFMFGRRRHEGELIRFAAGLWTVRLAKSEELVAILPSRITKVVRFGGRK
jgi:hypothetical protein